jgi:hypothetical protein
MRSRPLFRETLNLLYRLRVSLINNDSISQKRTFLGNSNWKKRPTGAAQSLFLAVGLLAGLDTQDSAVFEIVQLTTANCIEIFVNFYGFQLLSTL